MYALDARVHAVIGSRSHWRFKAHEFVGIDDCYSIILGFIVSGPRDSFEYGPVEPRVEVSHAQRRDLAGLQWKC